MRTWVFGLVGLVACAITACRESTTSGGVDTARNQAPAVAWIEGKPTLATLEAAQALFTQAAARESIDLHRLADRVGALDLLSVAEQGGSVGITALRALPLTSDAELLLAPLCELVAKKPTGVAHLLRAIWSIAQRPVLSVEALPDAPQCAPILEVATRDESMNASERDLATGARARLAARERQRQGL